MSNILSYGNNITYSSGNDPDVDLWLAQITGSTSALPSLNYINKLNAFVNDLKSSGIWLELDRLWIFATEQQQHAQISLVNPSSTRITEVNSPNWSFSGYSGDGQTMYLRTNYTASTSSVKYTLNNASFGVYSLTNIIASGATMGSNGSGVNYMYLYPRQVGNILSYRIQSVNQNVSNSDSSGLFSVVRTNSTNTQLFRNGISLNTSSLVSDGLPVFETYILCRNSLGSAFEFDSKQLSLVYIGSGNINQSTFYNTIQNFAIARGFNV